MSRNLLETPRFDPNVRFDKSNRNYRPIAWIDCEMTGLDVFNDSIIEIACVITDGNLNIIAPGFESLIHCDKEKLDGMDEWCTTQHRKSGLTQRVMDCDKTLLEVEGELLEYIQKYTGPNTAPMAGNTIHMDRFFIYKEMPRVMKHLSYRSIDVTSITEIGRRHNWSLVRECPRKRNTHTAMDDVLESIAQLKWLRDNYFVQPGRSFSTSPVNYAHLPTPTSSSSQQSSPPQFSPQGFHQPLYPQYMPQYPQMPMPYQYPQYQAYPPQHYYPHPSQMPQGPAVARLAPQPQNLYPGVPPPYQ